MKLHLLAILAIHLLTASVIAAPPAVPPQLPGAGVSLIRVPDSGLQPQIALDSKGVLHLVYYRGDPSAGDLFYVNSADYGKTFSKPLRVNSQPGSAMSIGNIRGAQLALGKNNRVHVVWNGSGKAEPKAPAPGAPGQLPGPGAGAAPMLYTRLKDDGSAFEDQRNLIQFAVGLDGGGAVAADDSGNVYVFWHGDPASGGETARRVFMARSSDDGKTFAREEPISPEKLGACACCGMRAWLGPEGRIVLAFRAATGGTNRDMTLLTSTNAGKSFAAETFDKWTLNTCPLSMTLFAADPADKNRLYIAWGAFKQVKFAPLDLKTMKLSPPLSPPGREDTRRYPALAANPAGQTLLAWTEGVGWNSGGAVHWQVFDKTGKPLEKLAGKQDGVPKWSLVAAFTKPDGSFVILY